jgi:protein-L-isoaspartate(D-aspartate) O-methyltransferase
VSAAEEANHHLVDQLIARGALWSRPLIEAFRATPRHRFLSRVWHVQRQGGGWHEVDADAPGRHDLRLLYADRALTTRLSEPADGQMPVPISSSSQPSLMAEMLEDLRLEPGLKTLEIGTGTGYNAALLAYAVGRVLSLEVDRRVLAEAAEHLQAFPDRRIELRHGDGRLGCPDEAPFARILVTAAALDLEPAWLEQLADHGLLLVPLDVAPGLGYLLCGSCRGGVFHGRLTRPAYFMPLREEDEAGRDNAPISSALLPAADTLPSSPAPWAEWSERKAASTGPGLLPSLAFLGWLHGHTIGYQALADGRTAFGIGDLIHGHACWIGPREWRVTGTAGYALGEQLWHDFLDAGGPWPTEFQLHAAPLTLPSPPAGGEGWGEGNDGESDCLLAFSRFGPRCRQRWTLAARRQRPSWP